MFLGRPRSERTLEPKMPETLEYATLPDATRDRYLRYALSVITSRALPDVRDGLKPVQRRILYTMEAEDGLHRVEDPALDGLQAVAHVREGAGGYDGQGVAEVAIAGCVRKSRVLQGLGHLGF